MPDRDILPRSIFVFVRTIHDNGRPYHQTVTIYASSEARASELLHTDIAELRRRVSRDDPSFEHDPAWQAHEVKLEREKIVSFVVNAA